ncbi:MAG: class I SAM-dependent methyltransferase family protein [Candidatus Micrarchaeia archaeon]
MVLCVRVKRQEAESARRKLEAEGVLDNRFAPSRDEHFVFFPVLRVPEGFEAAELPMPERKPRQRPLDKLLSPSLARKVPHSYDIIGDIAVLEIPPKLASRAKTVAEALLSSNPHLRLVLKKASVRKGVFRVRELKALAGKGSTETIHNEYGMRFKLDVAKAFFSPRLASERQRVASQVSPGERVLVLFAGVGPFAIAIARRVPSASVAGVELNPTACDYFKQNIRLNKCWNAEAVCGDVKEVVPARFASWADRVLLPLPKGAGAFLGEAFLAAKPGGIIHFYSFAREEEPFAAAERVIEQAASSAGRRVAFLNRKMLLPYAPRVVQVCVDFRIS